MFLEFMEARLCTSMALARLPPRAKRAPSMSCSCSQSPKCKYVAFQFLLGSKSRFGMRSCQRLSLLPSARTPSLHLRAMASQRSFFSPTSRYSDSKSPDADMARPIAQRLRKTPCSPLAVSCGLDSSVARSSIRSISWSSASASARKALPADAIRPGGFDPAAEYAVLHGFQNLDRHHLRSSNRLSVLAAHSPRQQVVPIQFFSPAAEGGQLSHSVAETHPKRL